MKLQMGGSLLALTAALALGACMTEASPGPQAQQAAAEVVPGNSPPPPEPEAGKDMLASVTLPAAGAPKLTVTSGGWQNMADIPYMLQYNKRDLPNVAPVEYMEFLLNNRDVQVPSFASVSHKCEGVFESLNMITRLLLNKFISQNTPQYA